MTTEIFKNEMLSAEQLDLVVGGVDQDEVDSEFFKQLGYNTARTYIGNAFADNGVIYSAGLFIWSKNTYKIRTSNGYEKMPHWAVLGYVLSKRNYPGFNGSWTDSNYVKAFIKDNFGINNID